MIDFQNMINGADLWIASSLMVMMSLIQAGLFLRTSWKEAGILGFSNKQKTACLRSAARTAAGPSLSPIIIMISMIAIVGGPTTWMVLNNVGAARTELAVVTMAANYAGVEIGAADMGVRAFTYALWAIALNGFGWLFVVWLLNHRMSRIVARLNQTYDPKWISAMLAGANLGLFAYLLSGQLVGKAPPNYLAAVIAGATMLILTKFLHKNHILQEISLGLSLLAGMFLTELMIN